MLKCLFRNFVNLEFNSISARRLLTNWTKFSSFSTCSTTMTTCSNSKEHANNMANSKVHMHHNSSKFSRSHSISTMQIIQEFKYHDHSDSSRSKLINVYKNVMSAVPQPVVIVTTAHNLGDEIVKRGVTCSTFTGVSLIPPIVSVCLNKMSRFHDILKKSKYFVVNVLSSDQANYGVHFSQAATDGRDQFEDIPHQSTENGIPVIDSVFSELHCQTHSVHDIGDHQVWYGIVQDCKFNDVNQSPLNNPLLYYSRRFHSIGEEMFMESFESKTLPFKDWTHEAHIRMAWNYLKKYGKEKATPLIKDGIKAFNEKNKEHIKRGYNETITIFYIHVIDIAIQKYKPEATFHEFIMDNLYLAESRYIFEFYSKDVINSEAASKRFIEPDIKSLPD